jgi:hypothetical protein
MKGVITILKEEIAAKKIAVGKLSELSISTRETEDAITYTTLDGCLIDFLSVLNENRICYDNHFDLADDGVHRVESSSGSSSV